MTKPVWKRVLMADMLALPTNQNVESSSLVINGVMYLTLIWQAESVLYGHS